MQKLAVTAFILVSFQTHVAFAQSYPAACTGSYRFTVNCCKTSYAANSEGKIQNATRIAALERCSLNERAAERKAKKKS